MKIGILTLPLHTNYGGLLQNYALQQVLKQLGHDVETIDYKSSTNTSLVLRIKIYLSKIKNVLYNNFIYHKRTSTNYCPNDDELLILRKNTNYFINKYISRSNTIYKTKDFKEISKTKRYDAYIVGSDQCWRPIYSSTFLKERFLDFAKNQEGVKRIAYGVSFGTDQWEMGTRMTIECSYLAKLFDIVTVREKSGVELCKKYLDIDATQVVDPTLLLNKEDYLQLVSEEHEPKSPGDLFCYILDPSERTESLIQEIGIKTRLIPFKVMPKNQSVNITKEDLNKHIEDFVFPAVTSWLRAFIDARMVIVDSFHGVVFSLIFNKPFWVLGNQSRGNARFESLLNFFSLEDRMITIIDKSEIDWEKPIEWEAVNSLMEIEKNRCITLLKDALS